MDIIIAPFHDYKKWINEGFRTRDAHLCQHFERNDSVRHILVINRPVSIAESIILRKKWKIGNGTVEYRDHCSQLCKMSDSVWCVDFFLPDFISVIRYRKAWWYLAYKREIIINEINKAIRYLKLENSVLILQNPMAVGLIGTINYRFLVFDAIDNWTLHPQMPNKDLIRQNYNLIDNKADLIIVVSDSLKQIFNNQNVVWIANGVDVEKFRSIVSTYSFGDRIRVGYIGKIQDRVDFDLVEKLLIDHPDIEYIFVGPVYSQKSRIRKMKAKYANIVFKGDVHYGLLLKELRNIDIAIIPHVVDDFTDSMNPIKIYEYLAAGKQVVSTRVAGTENFEGAIYIAEDYENFSRYIGLCVDNLKKEKDLSVSISNIITYEYSWENRAQAIISEVNKLIDKC
jgi:glycosyltransferase involved in cell wall biosynthesis